MTKEKLLLRIEEIKLAIQQSHGQMTKLQGHLEEAMHWLKVIEECSECVSANEEAPQDAEVAPA